MYKGRYGGGGRGGGGGDGLPDGFGLSEIVELIGRCLRAIWDLVVWLLTTVANAIGELLPIALEVAGSVA